MLLKCLMLLAATSISVLLAVEHGTARLFNHKAQLIPTTAATDL